MKNEAIGAVQREINKRESAIKRTEARIVQLRAGLDNKIGELEQAIESHRDILKTLNSSP